MRRRKPTVLQSQHTGLKLGNSRKKGSILVPPKRKFTITILNLNSQLTNAIWPIRRSFNAHELGVALTLESYVFCFL